MFNWCTPKLWIHLIKLILLNVFVATSKSHLPYEYHIQNLKINKTDELIHHLAEQNLALQTQLLELKHNLTALKKEMVSYICAIHYYLHFPAL